MKRIFREGNQDRNLSTATASNSGNNDNTNAIETGRGNNEYRNGKRKTRHTQKNAPNSHLIQS